MNDLEQMKQLKQRYFELVDTHGEEFTELKNFQQKLRALNKRHRLAAIEMYEVMIAKIETKAVD